MADRPETGPEQWTGSALVIRLTRDHRDAVNTTLELFEPIGEDPVGTEQLPLPVLDKSGGVDGVGWK